jgi:hypothetical protein
MKMMPNATIQPHLARNALMPSPMLCGAGLFVVAVMTSSFSAERTAAGYHAANGTVAASMGHSGNPIMQAEMNEAKKEPAVPRAATTVLLLRPSVPGDRTSPLEVFMVVRHHQIDSFSGALVPRRQLEDAGGDK